MESDTENENSLVGAIDKKTQQYILPKNANKETVYNCIDCKEEVFLKKGEIKAAHFSHYPGSSCKMYNYTRCSKSNDKSCESKLHLLAKEYLKELIEKKIKIEIKRCCLKCENEEIHLIREISEETKIILEYEFQYRGARRADVCYVDEFSYSEPEIVYIFEVCHTNPTNEGKRPEPWFDIKAEEIITNYYNQDRTDKIIFKCIRKIKCEKCQKEDRKIYYNQRGAGCGKTYESVHLINDIRFLDKQTFIYLTKMHSAKQVIMDEFVKNKHHFNLESEPDYKNRNYKRFEISYKIKTNEPEKIREVDVIIGTVDSFTWHCVDQKKIISHPDYFRSIIETIKDDKKNIKEVQDIRFIKNNLIDDNCLIIIDEAQDLIKEYFEAFINIMEKTNADLYIIGDKLQSILDEHNIFTYLESNKNTFPNLISSEAKNIVMRFHNEQFKELVNKVVRFEEFKLPPIEGICGGNCKYSFQNSDGIKYHCKEKPFDIFEMPKIRHNYKNDTEIDDKEIEKIDKLIDEFIENKIINVMEREINQNGYLPENFMIIFPILKEVSLAILIERRIQQFWIDKFKDKEYQNNVIKNNTYWNENWNENNFYKFIYLHKSEGTKPINLAESEHATQILSIHASKGNGREVVFVLNLFESALKIFSHGQINIIYESLLHVALTRQKKSLYVGVGNDDIGKRFKDNITFKGSSEEKNISNKTNILYILEYIHENPSYFNSLNEKYIKQNIGIIPNEKKRMKNKRMNK